MFLTENIENPSIESDLMYRTSMANTISKSPQPLQIENCIKSKCKIDNHHHKPSYTEKKSTIDSSIIMNPQLASEQYINIFNRYQVLLTIIIIIFRF